MNTMPKGRGLVAVVLMVAACGGQTSTPNDAGGGDAGGGGAYACDGFPSTRRNEEILLLRPMADSDGYWPGRRILHSPW